MLSMTGFGSGGAPLGSGRLAVEVRSLNHRFLEIRVRLPTELPEFAFFVEQRCRELLQRGRYDVTIRLEGAALPTPSIDLARGREAYRALCQLRDELAPNSEVPLSVLGSLSSMLTSQQVIDPVPVRDALDVAMQEAIANLNAMRQREGEALRMELVGLLDRAVQLRVAISRRAPVLVDQFRQRLQERVERALKKAEAHGIEPSRLEAEVVLFADRSDITEELARLSSHFEQFAVLCGEPVAIGRRLEFLLQEIGRETNTIGAKCPDVQLSHLVVELKAEIERIREQVQNVE
jgi:uncharacterized protein (TIGR00255 family)